MKADNGIQQPPVCPLCHQRCGRFLCPCCGGHAPFPWKCEACTPHTSPCMSHLVKTGNHDTLIGCLIVLVSIAIAVLFVLLIIQEVTS